MIGLGEKNTEHLAVNPTYQVVGSSLAPHGAHSMSVIAFYSIITHHNHDLSFHTKYTNTIPDSVYIFADFLRNSARAKKHGSLKQPIENDVW